MFFHLSFKDGLIFVEWLSMPGVMTRYFAKLKNINSVYHSV
jgi:hypothetical protein